jgi:hypothetical protein
VDLPVPLGPNKKKDLPGDSFNNLWNILQLFTKKKDLGPYFLYGGKLERRITHAVMLHEREEKYKR